MFGSLMRGVRALGRQVFSGTDDAESDEEGQQLLEVNEAASSVSEVAARRAFVEATYLGVLQAQDNVDQEYRVKSLAGTNELLEVLKGSLVRNAQYSLPPVTPKNAAKLLFSLLVGWGGILALVGMAEEGEPLLPESLRFQGFEVHVGIAWGVFSSGLYNGLLNWRYAVEQIFKETPPQEHNKCATSLRAASFMLMAGVAGSYTFFNYPTWTLPVGFALTGLVNSSLMKISRKEKVQWNLAVASASPFAVSALFSEVYAPWLRPVAFVISGFSYTYLHKPGLAFEYDLMESAVVAAKLRLSCGDVNRDTLELNQNMAMLRGALVGHLNDVLGGCRTVWQVGSEEEKRALEDIFSHVQVGSNLEELTPQDLLKLLLTISSLSERHSPRSKAYKSALAITFLVIASGIIGAVGGYFGANAMGMPLSSTVGQYILGTVVFLAFGGLLAQVDWDYSQGVVGQLKSLFTHRRLQLPLWLLMEKLYFNKYLILAVWLPQYYFAASSSTTILALNQRFLSKWLAEKFYWFGIIGTGFFNASPLLKIISFVVYFFWF